MKSLLESVTEIDEIVRQLHKMESRLRSGQIIDAWRECCRLMAYLEQCKRNIISDTTTNKNA